MVTTEKPGDTIWVRGVIDAPDDDEYPDCVHVAFDESGCSIYLDRREQFVPATRVVVDADVAAWGVVRHYLGNMCPPDDVCESADRLDRILAADAARTEGQG